MASATDAASAKRRAGGGAALRNFVSGSSSAARTRPSSVTVSCVKLPARRAGSEVRAHFGRERMWLAADGNAGVDGIRNSFRVLRGRKPVDHAQPIACTEQAREHRGLGQPELRGDLGRGQAA